ncbi:MAG TPA: glycosyltransferase [Candidatus Atribacteria bacterium]|nr:glycosyltransferase [Candidatus Atribacteria bacterium]
MVSIVIPTYNEEKILPRLLASIQKQIYKDWEVIVADNNSTDRTAEIAREFGARIVKGGLPGPGRNAGAKVAKGEIVLFLDADVQLDSIHFLEYNIRDFQKKKLDFAVARFSADSGSWLEQFLFSVQDRFVYHTRKKKPLTIGFCIFARTEFFHQVGGFEEDLKISEDVRFGDRAFAEGGNFGVLAEPLLASARRYRKEGALKMAFRNLVSGFHDLRGKKIKADDDNFKYDWDGYE